MSLVSITACLLLLAVSVAFGQWRSVRALSGTAGATTILTDDYWFCGPPYQGRVCDTYVEPGTAVVWDAAGADVEHSIVECGASCDTPTDDPAWDSGVFDPGTSYVVSFDAPAVYLYYCDLHPTQMRGRIIVGDVTPPPPSTPTPPGPTPEAGELFSVRDGLVIERFASGLDVPVNLALVPEPPKAAGDPFLYVSELYEGVVVVSHEGTVSTYADGLLNYDPAAKFPGGGENGVVGVAAEPASGDVFASLVAVEDGELKNRVVRLISSNDGRRAEGQEIVLDGPPAASSHQVQALSFGPDGTLYVNIGEAMQPSTAQDTASLLGKVLRLNPDGTVPSDNPTPGSAIFALGFRNPTGAAWSPEGKLYVTDNGPSQSGDRIARVDAGANYGWCCNFSQNALRVFSRDQGVGITALAFDAEHVLSPDDERHLFVAFSGPTYAHGVPASRGKWILDVELDAGDSVIDVSELLHYRGFGFSTVVGLVIAPNGLYFTDLYGEAGFEEGPAKGNIYRVFDPAREPTATPALTTTVTRTPTRTPMRTPTPITHVSADVDRSGSIDSIDAALILQFGAGLLAALPAPENGDLNSDGRVDAIDAAIILQFITGLLDALPP